MRDAAARTRRDGDPWVRVEISHVGFRTSCVYQDGSGIDVQTR